MATRVVSDLVVYWGHNNYGGACLYCEVFQQLME